MDTEEQKSPNTSINRCEVCKAEEAKYRCPKCLIRSCSLPCVKKHKENEACNGVRDKTKFTKVSEFKDLNLLSDYRFLEDVHRKADNASRDPVKYVSRDLPRHLKSLVNGAKRNGTNLRLLPKSFTRRMKNKTRFLHATKQILWMIEWVFPQAEAKHFDRHFQGDTVATALAKVYDPEKTDSIVRHTLRRYVAKGVEGVRFFLRKEQCPANDIRYYELKPSRTIEQSLKDKLVIEHPSIHVVYSEKAGEYPLVEGEESAESESESESDGGNNGSIEGNIETTSDKKRSSEGTEKDDGQSKRFKTDNDPECVEVGGSGEVETSSETCSADKNKSTPKQENESDKTNDVEDEEHNVKELLDNLDGQKT